MIAIVRSVSDHNVRNHFLYKRVFRVTENNWANAPEKCYDAGYGTKRTITNHLTAKCRNALINHLQGAGTVIGNKQKYNNLGSDLQYAQLENVDLLDKLRATKEENRSLEENERNIS